MLEAMETEVESMQDYFRSLEDPRSTINRKHLLGDLIVICICAVIAGADGPIRAAKQHGLDWVVTQAESDIALGKIRSGKVRAKEVPLRGTPMPDADLAGAVFADFGEQGLRRGWFRKGCFSGCGVRRAGAGRGAGGGRD